MLDPKISAEEMSQIYQKAKENGVIGENNLSVIFFDLTRLQERIEHLKKVFPPNVKQTVAIKTNPLIGAMEKIVESGGGLEAATFTEVELARAAGAAGNMIVYDSPVKTRDELNIALNEYGVRVNVDNLEELRRIETLVKDPKKAEVGLRVNPQIGTGEIGTMSVAGEYSKFGIPIMYGKDAIVQAFLKYPWLNGIHQHSGSQGLGLKMLVAGVKVIYDLAIEINNILSKKNSPNRIEYLDIGGGFPISYRPEETQLPMKDYVNKIKKECPEIFTEFKVINEFGRFNHARAGWVASKVEYVKSQPGYKTALIHVGADLFLREAYNPENWYHDISILNSDGHFKEQESQNLQNINKGNKNDEKYGEVKWNIAGPLCFSGDFIRKDVKISRIEAGDIILIHETGANTLNLWSRHCSRQIPKVVGYLENGDGGFKVLKKKESVKDLVDFWSS